MKAERMARVLDAKAVTDLVMRHGLQAQVIEISAAALLEDSKVATGAFMGLDIDGVSWTFVLVIRPMAHPDVTDGVDDGVVGYLLRADIEGDELKEFCAWATQDWQARAATSTCMN